MFSAIFAVFCLCAPANATENLIENLQVNGNVTIDDGVVSQIRADTNKNLSWKTQAWFNNERYEYLYSGTSVTYLFSGYYNASLGFISRTFTTPDDLEDLAYFRFGLNGLERDTVVSFDIKDVKPNTTYTLQWRVLNNTQGEIAWTDMLLVHCGDGYSLELGDENCSRECEKQSVVGGHIPPDSARVYEPAMCTYDAANLACDDGFARRGDECAQLCTAGMRHIKTGNGLSFNLYSVAYSVPALHVKRDDAVCYGVLAPGAAKNSININYNGQVYHMAD